MILLVAFIILTLLVIGGGKVYLSTKNKNGRWGLNINYPNKWKEKGVLNSVVCPSCEVELDKFRKPKNLQELLWGGWTCDNCGASIDKWGRIR